jgi:hypothetical protein
MEGSGPNLQFSALVKFDALRAKEKAAENCGVTLWLDRDEVSTILS